MLYKFSRTPYSWLLVCLASFLLFAYALVVQHFFGYEPCFMCITQRVALLFIFIAGLFGLVTLRFRFFRLLALLAIILAALYGANTAYEQYSDMFTPPSIFDSCQLTLNLPSWLDLDKWVPWAFEPTSTSCTDNSWKFLGQVMPFWSLIAFIGFGFIGTFFFIIELIWGWKK